MPAKPRSNKGKGRADYYKPGSNNCICDRTGWKMKVEDGRMEWNGFFVHKSVWEERQPQDLLRGFPDDQSVEVSRPGTGDVFLDIGDVTPEDL